MTVLLVIVFIGALFNIAMTLVMNTKNFLSAILFKILPFFFGLATVIYALKQYHII